MRRRLGTVGFIVAILATACSSGAVAGGTTPSTPGGVLRPATDLKTPVTQTLDGAGANSVYPFFQRVFFEYSRKNPKTTVNFSPAGSSVGISDIQKDTVNFGDTEIPMAASDLAKATGPILQVPVDLGGVAISYNIPNGPKALKLDGPTLAAIFQGTITNWDDPRIAAVSGVHNLPNLAIAAAHRADSSGPGWDLDQYLIDTAPSWKAQVGSTASKTWPVPNVGVGQQLNSGVATYIAQTIGAIGYVEYGYALEAHFTNVSLKNAAGKFVAPSEKSIAAAGSLAKSLNASNFSIINESGKTTYPLANFSWTLLYATQPDLDTAIALGRLFDYVVTTGQKDAGLLGYAPLPANVVKLSISTLDQLHTASGPVFSG